MDTVAVTVSAPPLPPPVTRSGTEPPDDPATFGPWFFGERRRARISRRTVAQVAAVDERTVKNVELCRHPPHRATIDSLRAAARQLFRPPEGARPQTAEPPAWSEDLPTLVLADAQLQRREDHWVLTARIATPEALLPLLCTALT